MRTYRHCPLRCLVVLSARRMVTTMDRRGNRLDLTLVDIRRVLKDAPYKDLPVMLKCPEHADDTTSLAIYRDHIVCYGCGFRVQRRMDALAWLLKVDVRDAIKQASKYLALAPVETRAEGATLPPLPRSIATTYERTLWGYRRDRVGWLRDRGLAEETIKAFHLGHDGTRFTIPLYGPTGELLTIRYRRDDALVPASDPDSEQEKIRKYSGVYQRNDLRLYPEWRIAKSEETFIVAVEGELDACLLWQFGIPACSPTNGAGSLCKLPDLLAPYPHIRSIYIAADQDEPGERGAQELITTASHAGYQTVRLTWPVQFGKDITELMTKGIEGGEEYRQLFRAS